MSAPTAEKAAKTVTVEIQAPEEFYRIMKAAAASEGMGLQEYVLFAAVQAAEVEIDETPGLARRLRLLEFTSAESGSMGLLQERLRELAGLPA